jgi:E3 ubiquitin-protein ligase HUWE1
MESSEFAQGLTEPNYEDDGDREVVETILNFSRILLENCGNRSIYASSPHLSDLLNSTSLTLIASTLHIGTQLAQRYQASFKRISGSHRQANAALLMNHYNIDLERVLQLAQPFSRIIIPEAAAATVPTTPATPNPKGKDKAYFSIPATPAKVAPVTVYANDLVSMVRGGTSARGSPKGMTAASAPTHSASSENDWKAWLDVHLAYHVPPQQGEPEGTTALNTSQSAPATPTPIRRSSTLGQAHTQRSNRASTSDETATTTPSRSSTFQAATDVAKSPNLKVVDVPAVEDANINSLIAGYLHSVPDSTHYTLLQKLRVAYAMADSLETRRQILAVRILAITNLAYIYTEPIFLDKVLKQDSEEPRRLQLIYQLAELIHPPAEGDIGVPRYLQTIALNALEALAQHQSKYQDICTALNTNVNHGVLLYIVRKAVAEMSVDEQGNVLTEKDEWRTALFSLLTHVATLPRAGNELVTAGLVPILVEVLTLRTTIAQHNWPKILSFLDAIVFNVRDAFQVLVNAEGLDALSSLIVYEVDSASARAEAGEGMPEDFRSPAIDYDIPYFQQQSIKWLFKFIHHMMNTAGGYGTNFDRLLRNLIDSPQLLGSLRQIIGHSKRFGATAWTNAVSILNDFINNEPTSFAVIAEAGLSRGVLEAVTGREITVTDVPNQPQSSSASRNEASSPAQTDDEDLISFDTDSDDTAPHPPTREMLQTPRPGRLAQGIMPSPEAIIIIPEAFGAICLNSAGMRMFMKSDALRSFFEIFESRSHIKAFDNDSSLATTLGSTFDELVRHHPPLKAAIMNAVLDMVARVSHLCKTRLEAEKEGAKLWATNSNGELVVSDDCLSTSAKGKEKAASTDLDVQMSGVGDTFTTSTDAAPSEEDSNANITPYVSAVALFLVAMFNNSGIRTIFMEKGGMEYILDLAELPILPYSVSDERASRHLHTVIALLAEQKTHLVIPSLIKRVQTATDTLAEFTQYNDPESYFGKFVKDASVSNEPEVNARLASGRGLVVAMMKVHNLITSLRSCIQPPVYTRSSTLTFTAMNLADLYIKLVNSLGPLLGATIREDFKMTKLVPQHWKRAARSRDGSIPPKDFVEPSYPTIDSSADTLQSVLQDGSAPITTLTSESAARPPPAAPASQSLSSAERKSAEFRNFQTLRYLLAKVPIVIPTFFQALGKALVSKRNPDAFQRQCNALIADALAETVLSQLNFPKDDTSGESYTYWVLMLGAVKDLLVNSSRHTERPKECITIVLQAFKQRKGFDTINRILGVFGVEIKKNADKTISASDADILLRNDLATLGMKHILDLYLSLSNGKNIAEATQTSLMASRSDREKNSSNYFSPAQFLIELRMAVLPVVRELWESSIVEKGSKIIPSRLIEIIRTIALADHEGGAFRRADHVSHFASFLYFSVFFADK